MGRSKYMKNEHITALIAAGGKGTRLGEITRETPKPLVKVMDKPIMEHVIESLNLAGINNVAIRVLHQKQQIIDYSADRYRIIDISTESLFPPLIELANQANCDYLLGLNGDTLVHPDSIVRLTEMIDKYPDSQALVLNTTITRPNPGAEWTYWRHNFNGTKLASMDEVVGSKLDTECIALLFKRSAILKASQDFTDLICSPEKVPFKNFGVGWNHIVRMLLWNGADVRGLVGDDLCLNINKPDELTEASMFFHDPAQFRFRRLTPRGGTSPIMTETTLITVLPGGDQSATKSYITHEVKKLGLEIVKETSIELTEVRAQAILNHHYNGDVWRRGQTVDVMEISGQGAYYRGQQITGIVNEGSAKAETVRSTNSFDIEKNKIAEVLYSDLPVIRG